MGISLSSIPPASAAFDLFVRASPANLLAAVLLLCRAVQLYRMLLERRGVMTCSRLGLELYMHFSLLRAGERFDPALVCCTSSSFSSTIPPDIRDYIW